MDPTPSDAICSGDIRAIEVPASWAFDTVGRPSAMRHVDAITIADVKLTLSFIRSLIGAGRVLKSRSRKTDAANSSTRQSTFDLERYHLPNRCRLAVENAGELFRVPDSVRLRIRS